MKVFLIIAILFFGLNGTYIVSLNDNLVSLKNTAEEQSKKRDQFYSTMLLVLKQKGVVVKNYSDSKFKLEISAISSRYGVEGAKAAMLFIKENNPNLSPELYKELMQTVEIKYNEFNSIQNTLYEIDKAYKGYFDRLISGLFVKILNFNRNDLEKYVKVLYTDEAKSDLENGHLSSPELFQN